MKTFLCYLRHTVWAFSLLGIMGAAKAQKVKGLKTGVTKQTQRASLYKQSKIYDSKSGATESKPTAVGDRAADRIEYEFNRLKNPKTGKIPTDIRNLEVNFSKKIAVGTEMKQAVSSAKSTSKSDRFSYWENRGPFNVGGRTRALAIDRMDEDIIMAGGVSGGLWRSTDAGETWRKITRRRQSPSITAIVQDPRPGKHRIWYYGTGERFGNSAGGGGAFFQGTGIFKSTNGGLTWKLLEATNDNDVRAFSPFDIINSLVIDPRNGDLYVGTLDGLHRSQDGGETFEEVLESGFLGTVEVAVTSEGQLYATIRSSAESNAGFYTSSNGTEWISITPGFLPATIGRTVMGINPSNENEVYFLAQNTGEGSPAFLLKYNATAQKADASWVDLTVNIPTTLGRVGNLNLQGGYNMMVKVSPADPNLVFIGGTNIYRSTDGFTTPVDIKSWIAGYKPGNTFAQYTNQHPDQHAFIFYPSDPTKVLSGNDGGIYVTEDITATKDGEEPVEWIDLNNGYITTQPYHVAFDPSANSDDLLAGFQDNGTWYTNSTDGTAPWIEDFGGDGAYSAIADGGRTRYVSSQRGNVYRFNFDETGTFQSFARIRPAGANNLAFVMPFVLDPNNDNIMYLPAGNRIWRNNNLDEVPTGSNALATVNWVNLPNTDTPDDSVITALDVSTYPIANVLYYGTNKGQLFRMNNANLDNQEVVDVFTGKGLPAGYINDINIDPSNSDRVIISFSNYGIQSIFMTKNGGETWQNVSGNLEENQDGTGNGPSVRSTAFLGSSQGLFGSTFQKVFAATSTGLYYTNRLNGNRTRWFKESFVIANSVADEVVSRKDGFIALAAHGSGVFSARFPVINQQPETTLSTAYLLDDIKVLENSEDIQVNIADLFVSSTGTSIAIELTNSNPELVTAVIQGDSIRLSFKGDSFGQATIGLVATSNGEQVSEGFTVTISESAIYEQIEASVRTFPSQLFTDFGALAQSSDDFTVPAASSWTVERIVAFGAVNNAPLLDKATIVIYENNEGVPGVEVYNSGEITPVSEPTDVNLNLELPTAIVLESGSYWLTVYANLAFSSDQKQWFWSAQEGGVGQETQFKDEKDLFGIGAVDWTPASTAFGVDSLDQVFQIFGKLHDLSQLIQTGNEIAEPLAVLESEFTSLVWPNPSATSFTFDFKSLHSKNNISISILDITGSIVHKQSNIAPDTRLIWDASDLRSGFYFAKISGDAEMTFKLVKK